MSRYSGLDNDGNWDPQGSCPNGCGQPADECICKLPEPLERKTLTQIVREAEADVTDEDLGGMSREEWQRIRQWPEDG